MSVHNNPSRQYTFVQDTNSFSPYCDMGSKSEPKKEMENPLDAQAEDTLLPNECFAESTYLKIDEQATERLERLKKEVHASKIITWVGSDRNYLRVKGYKISIKDARLINNYSKRSIFEIKENHLFQFKVIDSARKTLTELSETYNLQRTSRNLNLNHRFLQSIKTGDAVSITHENAIKIEKFFQKDVFCIHRIFLRACTENINEKKELDVQNSSGLTLLSVDEESNNKAVAMDPAIKMKIKEIIGTIINQHSDTISIRNAFVSNKVAGTNIFRISAQNLAKVPFSNETRDQLKELIQNKIKDYKLLQAQIAVDLGMKPSALSLLKKGEQKTIPFDRADRLNAYFGSRLFDFEKIVNDAKLESADFYETSLKKTREIQPLATETQRNGKRKNETNNASPAKRHKVDPRTTKEEAIPFKIQEPHPIEKQQTDYITSNSPLSSSFNLENEFASKKKENEAILVAFKKVLMSVYNNPSRPETKQTDCGMSNSPLSFYSISVPESELLPLEEQQQLFDLPFLESFFNTTTLSTEDPELRATSHDDLMPTHENAVDYSPLVPTTPRFDSTPSTQSHPEQDTSKPIDSEFKFFF